MLYFLVLYPLYRLGRFCLLHPLQSISAGVFVTWLFSKFPRFRYAVRTALFYVCVGISCVLGMSSVLLLYPFRAAHYCNYIVARCTNFLIPLLTGVRFQVAHAHRLQGKRPCIFLANHQSALDLAAMGAVMPTHTVILAKRDLKWIPFIGWYLNLSKNIFIDRGNTRSAIATMHEVSVRMKEQGLAVFLYPEGTRSYQTNHTLLPFKKGAFHLALEGDFDIIPIVASTYHPVYSESDMRFERGTVHIRVCEPIRPAGRPLEEVMEETRAVMQRALQEVRSIPLEGGASMSSSTADASTSPISSTVSLRKVE